MFRGARISAVIGAVAVLGACTAGQEEGYKSQMSAEEAGVQSTASGSAQFTLNGDQVDYSVTVSGLSSPVLAVHIHHGPAGGSGPRRVDLFVGPTTDVPDGVLAAGSFNAADVVGITFRELLTAMRTGQVYVNVHTIDVLPGEMRGQIVLDEAAVAPSITGPAQ